jgi:hypothetical protein
MTADVARDLAAAGRVADMDRILQVKLPDKLGEIIRIGVEIVAVSGLTRAAMPAAIMRDAAVALARKEEHLVFEGVRAERPAVAEDDGLTFAPVVVIDRRAVLGRDRAHDAGPHGRAGRKARRRNFARNTSAHLHEIALDQTFLRHQGGELRKHIRS